MAIEEAYREDLAYIHDAAYGDVARDAADKLLAELARAGHREGTIVDLGCGSGVFAERLVHAGYHVVGVDTSHAMVTRARVRVPGGEFHVGSFLSADLPSCVAITAIGEVLNYCVDSANDARARTDFLRRAYDALVPGGHLLFDIAGLTRAKPGGPHRTFAEGNDWAVLVETEGNAATRLLTRRITSFRQIGTLYRRSVEVHALALIDPVEVLDSLRSAGFEAEAVATYGTVPLPDGVIVLVSTKPGH